MRLIPLLVISALVLTPSLHAQEARPDAAPAADSVTYDAYGLRLFRYLADDPAAGGRNIFISPVSAGTAFSLALLGADGTTRDSLARALGVSAETEDALHRGNERLVAALRSPGVTLTVANSLWGRPDAPFIPAFTEGARRWYGATVTPVDFRDPQTPARINAWAAEATHGRIRDVIKGPMDTATALVLVNAVYFKGRWATAFRSADTKPEPFRRVDGSVVRVPTMHGGLKTIVAHQPGFRIARVPYQEGRFAMYIFLPDSGRTVRDVTRALQPETWRWQDVRWERVNLGLNLPRFTVRDTVELSGPMRAMGAGLAFDRRAADFTRAVPRSWLDENEREAWLGRARQSTFVQVDEEGTEAAAVTGLSMMIGPTSYTPHENFIVDRPFVVLIRDDRTGALLFIGLIQDPMREGPG